APAQGWQSSAVQPALPACTAPHGLRSRPGIFLARVDFGCCHSSSWQNPQEADISNRQRRRLPMAKVSTYLNFPGNTEAAFDFYRSVFETKYEAPGIRRMGEVPATPGQPPLPEAARRLVLHVALPITGGHVLMGTDADESMGFKLVFGNNM